VATKLPPGSGVLIVGYGNRLRSDDGLGWHATERLAADPRVSGAEIFWRHQLMPELSADFGQASLVVLIDANGDLAPGAIEVKEVAASVDGTLMSHHIDPESLVALTVEMSGAAPPVYIVSVGPDSLEVGELLSPVVERAVPELVETVVRIVAAEAAVC
jgi:hydrogenase maturation protease